MTTRSLSMAGAAGLEPAKCRSQSPVPYHLGDAPILNYDRGGWTRTITITESESVALPFGYAPILNYITTMGFWSQS